MGASPEAPAECQDLGEPNVLTGRIFCADCGAPMYNHRNGNPRTRVYYTAKGERRTQKSNPEDSFECSTYNLSRQMYGRTCSCHHISTSALKRIILETIQKTCSYVSLNEQDFVRSLQEASVIQNASVSDAVKRRIDQNEKRVHELDLLIRKIYEDNVAGRLPDKLFQNMLADYKNEQEELEKVISIDRSDMKRIVGGQLNVDRFIALVKKYQTITELTPSIINEFVDKVLVHEPTGKGADRSAEIEIYLNYIGQFKVPEDPVVMTEEEKAKVAKEAERLRRKRKSNRRYMKKVREMTKSIRNRDEATDIINAE